jgi:ribosomal protein RSM22 (predicted rRNA methylase)
MTVKNRRKTAAALKRRRARLASRLPDAEQLLRGSLVERHKKCGRMGCHCANDIGHGPAYYLSVTLAPGKTRSYYVPPQLKSRVSRYLRNHRKLRELLKEITELNQELLAQGVLDDD